MATRAQVLELLKAGHSYQSAARELGEPAGRVYMIATGLPADGSEDPADRSEDPAAQRRAETPPLDGSSQNLVNPPSFNPKRKPHVLDWVRQRAARDLEPRR